VQAVARIEGDELVVYLPGTPSVDDERHLRAYLQTWLRLAAARGTPVTANVFH
jgi:GGDEF domain-containing protein